MTFTNFKRAARLAVGASKNTPVYAFPGSDAAPKMEGRYGHYETKSGKTVTKAYLSKGWSTTHYVTSTLRVEVGADWIPVLERVIIV